MSSAAIFVWRLGVKMFNISRKNQQKCLLKNKSFRNQLPERQTSSEILYQ